MADAHITSSDVIVPRIDEISRISIETAYKPLSLLNSPAVERIDGMLRNGGNQVTVYSLDDTLALQDVPTDGSDLESDELTLTPTTLTLLSKAVMVAEHKYTREDMDPNFNLDRAIGEAVGNKLRPAWQDAMFDVADATTLTHPCDADITFADIVNAMATNWGDRTGIMGDRTLVCHSKVFADILQLAEVKNSNQFSYGVPGPAMTGVVPMLAGMRLVVYDNDDMYYAGDGTYKSFICGAGALKLYIKKELGRDDTAGVKNGMKYQTYDSRFVAWSPKVGGVEPIIEITSTSSLDD